MIRLHHPAHGWHVLSPFDDLSKMQGDGWVIEGAVPDRGPPLVESVVEPAPVEAPALPVVVKRKPGRPRKNRDDGPADHH